MYFSHRDRLERNLSSAGASVVAIVAIGGVGRLCDGTRARVLVTAAMAVGIELFTFSGWVHFDQ